MTTFTLFPDLLDAIYRADRGVGSALAEWSQATLAFPTCPPWATPEQLAACDAAERRYRDAVAARDAAQLAYCIAVVADAKQAGRL